MSDSTFLKRTHTCGELRQEHIDQEVVVNGWVHRWRDHGGVVFIDLRDRYGIVQVVFDPQDDEDAHDIARDVRSEWVIAARGVVEARPDGMQNPKLDTGMVEIRSYEAEVLSQSETPPFSHTDHTETDELVRMQYRYLDLRSERMQRNLKVRAAATAAARDYLDDLNFIETETPILFRPTPEGARDFLVPSRVNPGKFYALPQSPQILKQLLMISGMDRYYQIARCLRDEDLRADRQPEHTQVDIEMSFVEQTDIIDMTEGLFAAMFKQAIGIDIDTPWPRITYQQAIEKYGSDKPDLRFGLEFVDISDIAADCEFRVFAGAVDDGGRVKGICAKGCGDYPRAQLDRLTEFAQDHEAKGLAWMRVVDDGVDSPIAKFFTEDELTAILEAFEAETGDLLLMVADSIDVINEALGALRHEMARRENLIDDDEYQFVWVLEFPMFDRDEERKKWVPMHHPFTMPHPQDWQMLQSEPGKVRAVAHDVALNGVEVAGGSIRIHRKDIQQRVFRTLGLDEQAAHERFGFFLEAFEYGAPPHGGIALGLDRIVAIMCGEQSIRDVIAFPKTQRGQCLMSGAPTAASDDQLDELYIRLNLPPEQ